MKGYLKKMVIMCLIPALVFAMNPVPISADTQQEPTAQTNETSDTVNSNENMTKLSDTDSEKGKVLVYGRIEGSQHWTKDNIYYVVTDSALFDPVIIGDLVIDPGTTVYFGHGNTVRGIIHPDTELKSASSLRILYGNVTAKGTADEPIIFKQDTNDTNWAGIILDSQIEDDTKKTCKSGIFEYCQFINGGEWESAGANVLSIDSASDQDDYTFQLTVDHCTFDSTEVVNDKLEAGKALVDGGNAICCNTTNRKTDIKVTDSVFRGMAHALSSAETGHIYPENFSCLIEGNNFETCGYYNNSISEGKGYIEWSANAVIKDNTFHNTSGNELDAPACWLSGGCATYEIEGNAFIGNEDTTGDNANRYAPLKINIGANVNSDKTKTYAPNTCNYGSDVGKYAEIVSSTPKQPEYITGDTGYLGVIGGLAYRMHYVSIDYSRKVTIAPGATCYMANDINIESTGKLIARGTSDKPIHFVGTNGYYSEYIRVNAGWTKDNYADSSAETVFENCTFDKKITILASLVETNGEVPEELPVTLYMRDCRMNDVARGIEVNIRGNDSEWSMVSCIDINNVTIKGRGDDGESDDRGFYIWTNYYPDDVELIKISNCRVYNFTNGTGIYTYINSCNKDSADLAGKQCIFDHMTVAGCAAGIYYGGQVLPVIKNSIIAGNTKTFSTEPEADQIPGIAQNITYSCLYNNDSNNVTYSYGTGCIVKDPYFADAAAGDFHLMSTGGRWNGTAWVYDTVTSPCIDAGDVSDSFINEPLPNGNRVNMGAYGNTTEASRPGTGGGSDDGGPSAKPSSTPGSVPSAAPSSTPGSTPGSESSAAPSSTPGSTPSAAPSSTPDNAVCMHVNKELRDSREAACETEGYTGDTYCKDCGKKLSVGTGIAATGHSPVVNVQKASTDNDGMITTSCIKCKAVTGSRRIAKVSVIKLNKTRYTFNGKKQTPSVILTDSDGNALIENTDYIVKMPDGMKDVGNYKIEVVLNGSRYSGNAEVSFRIAPKGTNITRLRAAKKSAAIKWKKRTSQTDGYQIRYSVDSRFKKGNKLVTVNKGNKNSKKLTGLQAKKKYYITIRTYKTVGKQRYYSEWSKKYKVTTR